VSTPSRPLLVGLLVVLAFAGVYFVALKPPGKGADSNSQFNAPISDAQKAVVQSQVDAAKAEQAGADTTASVTPKPDTALATAKPATPVHPGVKHSVTTHPAVKHPAAVKHAAATAVVIKHHAPKASQLQPWDHSAKILASIAHGNVAVVLFWTKGGADDNSVRRAVQQVSQHKQTSAFVIPMKDVGKYEAITGPYEVTVSPTVLVVGPRDQFIPIVGYATAPTIQQYVNSVR